MANTKSVTSFAHPASGTTVITIVMDTNGAVNIEDGHNNDHITIQATGAFGGGTVSILASNDGVNYAALPTPVTINAAGLYSGGNIGFRHYQASLAGAAGASITLTFCFVRHRS